VGSYRIWAKEHQRWTALTGKTKIESLDDRISEFQALQDLYGSDSQTTPLPLEELIEETLNDLLHHAPDYVHHFKSIAKNWQQSISITEFPQRSSTLKELNKWSENKDREECWRIATVCARALQQIRTACTG